MDFPQKWKQKKNSALLGTQKLPPLVLTNLMTCAAPVCCDTPASGNVTSLARRAGLILTMTIKPSIRHIWKVSCGHFTRCGKRVSSTKAFACCHIAGVARLLCLIQKLAWMMCIKIAKTLHCLCGFYWRVVSALWPGPQRHGHCHQTLP